MKNYHLKLKKELNNEVFHLQVYEFNSINAERIQQLVPDTCCVFIIFDITNRGTFTNLLNTWLIWLRDTIKYQGAVFILGNIIDNTKFRCTDKDEILELIQVSEVQAQYFEVGDQSNNEKNAQIDKLIMEAEDEKKKRADGSKDKNCLIF